MSADDDRFEALVRQALREEETHLPVRITAREVRARAGARGGRWSLPMQTGRLLGSVVPIAAAIAVVAVVAFGPWFSAPEAGTSPSAIAGGSPSVTPAAATPQPTVAPTPTPAPTPSPMVLDLGAPGDLVVVSAGEDANRVISVGPDGQERVVYEDAGTAGYRPTGDRVSVSVRGHLAIEVEVEASDGALGQGTWIIDMRDPRDPGRLLPGGRPTFGPNGDLVTMQQDRATAAWTINRFLLADGDAFGSTQQLPEPQGLSVATVFAADGSGLFATRHSDEPATPVILGWDGSVVDRDPADAPWFATGIERPTSAAGHWISRFCDDGPSGGTCGTTLESPDGVSRLIPVPRQAFVYDAVWDRTGRTVVFTTDEDDRTRVYAVRAADLANPRQVALVLDGGRITGMTDDAAIVELGRGATVVVALDGSGTVGDPHDGRLALIVP